MEVTEQELDALQHDLRTKCPYPAAGNAIVIGLLGDAATAITTLRAQLAEVIARTEQAEAERAAQIEVDAGICDEMYGGIWDYDAYDCALAIRAQPHSRTALDAAIRAAKVEAWKEAAGVAANACLVDPDGGSPTEEERLVCDEAYRRILALIEREATHD